MIAAKKRGWDVAGIEPSIESVELAQRQYRLDVFNGTFQEYDETSQFDVITFINVLDHLVEPWKDIEKALKVLKPNGIIFIRFPNGFLHTGIYGLASQLKLANLVRNLLVFHQFSFTPKFIKRLLVDNDLSEITILNSPPSEGDPYNLFLDPTFGQRVKRALFLIAQAVQTTSCGKILLGTSLEVMAVKRRPLFVNKS